MTSIWARKIDLLYFVFFVIHIPIMLMVDLGGLYPSSIVPQAVLDTRQWYIATYRDRFFTDPPTWFYLFLGLEAVYHLPLSFWAAGALLRDDPLVPLHLLIWSVETGMSTAVCIVEAMSWDGYTQQEMIALAQLYVPYLLLAVLMGGDMFLRVRVGLKGKVKAQ